MIECDITYYDASMNSIRIDEIQIEEPRQCMHCTNTGKQELIKVIGTTGKLDKFDAIAIYACPFCASTTIHYLMSIKEFNTTNFKDFYYYKSFDTIPSINQKPTKFNEDFNEKFSEFVKIYSQSEEAQNSKLDHLAGMGYRKALEFLVTDYLIEYPVDGVEKEWLTNPDTRLANKISKIESKRIQKLAKAISFLGNDETHYTRKHPEYDVSSIKSFIAVLLSEIQNEIDFQEAEKLLNKPKF